MTAYRIDYIVKPNVPQSLLSFSDESLTSGDENLFSAAGSHNGSASTHEGIDLTASTAMYAKSPGVGSFTETYKGITIPIDDEFDIREFDT